MHGTNTKLCFETGVGGGRGCFVGATHGRARRWGGAVGGGSDGAGLEVLTGGLEF